MLYRERLHRQMLYTNTALENNVQEKTVQEKTVQENVVQEKNGTGKRPGDAAWDSSRYHSMWESLREEFELNERFSNLNFKLELIQHNTKFFLELLGERKGERLEWYIIILISIELGRQ